MPDTIILAAQIQERLPREMVEFMQTAGTIAAGEGQRLYLVGGVVRDLLLGRSNLDLDMVVEGDAIQVAQRLAGLFRGKVTIHTRFGTAKVKWDNWSADLATCRAETYERQGALPTVRPSLIADDLFRRDFTINAMAIELYPVRYGQLIDLYGGKPDLDNKLIRVLHDKSFTDDATRIWRAIRYEQRLDFHIEPKTLRLLERDIPMLDTISGDRIRHELELVLKEALPEKVLGRADELGALAKIHPSLKGDGWLYEKFRQVRDIASGQTLPALYLALLAYRLARDEIEQVIAYLKPTRTLQDLLRSTVDLKTKLGVLAGPGLTPMHAYHLLHDYSPSAIMVNFVAIDSEIVRQRLQLYLSKLRYVRPALTGDDLIRMGMSPGPRMKEFLERLREGRLDGTVKSREEEERLVREWIESGQA